jgi:hypothetical protein
VRTRARASRGIVPGEILGVLAGLGRHIRFFLIATTRIPQLKSPLPVEIRTGRSAMALDAAVLMKFVRSLNPPLEVRLIDIYGRVTVIHADTAETPEIETNIALCRWAQIGEGPTMLCYVFEEIVRKFEQSG